MLTQDYATRLRRLESRERWLSLFLRWVLLPLAAGMAVWLIWGLAQ